jgi:hypothetical protein
MKQCLSEKSNFTPTLKNGTLQQQTYTLRAAKVSKTKFPYLPQIDS